MVPWGGAYIVEQAAISYGGASVKTTPVTRTWNGINWPCERHGTCMHNKASRKPWFKNYNPYLSTLLEAFDSLKSMKLFMTSKPSLSRTLQWRTYSLCDLYQEGPLSCFFIKLDEYLACSKQNMLVCSPLPITSWFKIPPPI